jgi:hypothetical protein
MNVYNSVLKASWAVGVISLLASVVVKLVPILQAKLGVSPHGGMVTTAVLFLCVLATGEARKTPPSS